MVRKQHGVVSLHQLLLVGEVEINLVEKLLSTASSLCSIVDVAYSQCCNVARAHRLLNPTKEGFPTTLLDLHTDLEKPRASLWLAQDALPRCWRKLSATGRILPGLRGLVVKVRLWVRKLTD